MWESERFPRYKTFHEVKGLGNALSRHWGFPISVTDHKKHEYIYGLGVGIRMVSEILRT